MITGDANANPPTQGLNGDATAAEEAANDLEDMLTGLSDDFEK